MRRQAAEGKVLWHFTMSRDGFVAGPNHTMDWMTETSFPTGLIEEYADDDRRLLGGREGLGAHARRTRCR